MKIPFWAKILFGILICNAVGLAASTVTIPAISEWYVTLNKPSFNPPDWLVGPVWTLLYTLMGISAAAVWQAGTHKPEVVQALQFFGLQLLFNGLWSFLFFGLKNPADSYYNHILEIQAHKILGELAVNSLYTVGCIGFGTKFIDRYSELRTLYL